MDEQTKGFRSAVFGGFRREDVLRYIEETDANYYKESARRRPRWTSCASRTES